MRVCFLTERQVGHNSVAGVLQRYAAKQTDVDVTWCDVTYHVEGGLIEGLPLPERTKGVLRGYQQTGKGLSDGPFDALFFFTHNPAVFRHAALKKTPACVWTDVTPAQYHELADAYEQPVARSRVLRFAKFAAVRRTFRLARRCLGFSEWARRSFVNDYGIEERNTGVVPPGVDLAFWQGGESRHGDRAPFRLVFVGGHFERKGGRLLLDVFRERFRGRCELSIVTRDPIEDEPGVRVHRGITAGSDALRALLKAADAFVLPTVADCHSIASLEAMASGLPVILTRFGAAPEIILDGETGLLIPAANGRALGDAIEALVSDPARARGMGERGLSLVRTKFEGEATVRKILDHLREIARQ